MNVFETHARIVRDYEIYIKSFLRIADPGIWEVVKTELGRGKLWPEPLLQFNPAFEMVGSLDALTKEGTLHSDTKDIFRGYQLYHHRVEAIRHGTEGRDFVVTSGTGSGKSLTYIGTIFHWLLTHPNSEGVTASASSVPLARPATSHCSLFRDR